MKWLDEMKGRKVSYGHIIPLLPEERDRLVAIAEAGWAVVGWSEPSFTGGPGARAGLRRLRALLADGEDD